MDRRVPFFLIAAAVSFVLSFVAPPDLRWVPLVTASVYVVLALLTLLDVWSRTRAARKSLR